MKNIDIARAMKDSEYRSTLTAEELALLPENAAGVVALGDADLLAVSGGRIMSTKTGSNGVDTERGPCCG
jgi:mersacidin/lichenicidin family type 2 lantibiotic